MPRAARPLPGGIWRRQRLRWPEWTPQRIPRCPPGDSLARQIAIAEQDLETIRTTDQNFWQSECLQKVLMGDAMWRAGSAVEARPFLEAVLDASCLAHTHQRTATVLAHVSLAELMRAEGEDAQTHIAAARALWPNPDPEIPLNQRLLALESGVD